MTLLEDGAVLHRRFVRFGNLAVEGEVLGGTCLTRASGEHPLASGFREVQVRGVSDVRVTPGRLLARGAGVSISVHGGGACETGGGWLVEV